MDNIKWGQPPNVKRETQIEFNGKILTLNQWAARIHITPETLMRRLRKYTIKQALNRNYRPSVRTKELKSERKQVKEKKQHPVKQWLFIPPVESLI